MRTSTPSLEDPDEELWELLTCHRSESDGAFPWTKPARATAVSKPVRKRVVSLAPLPEPRRARAPTIMDQEPAESPLSHVLAESQALGIRFELPGANDLAGSVLRHASHRINVLSQKQSPMIWKVGLCHDPKWRWTNSLYGYRHARDRWSEMIVLYISKEACGPAMLESALIDKFSSMPGCRNERLGGDTVVADRFSSESQHYMVYIVYRSFKHPPEVGKK